MGVLFEPSKSPWCTPWHRDWRDHMPAAVFDAEFRGDWQDQMFDYNHCNQINCALYEDSSTWIVPGSHARQDTPAEAARATRTEMPPVPVWSTSDLPAEEAERTCLEYCAGFPGALRLVLDAGDYAGEQDAREAVRDRGLGQPVVVPEARLREVLARTETTPVERVRGTGEIWGTVVGPDGEGIGGVVLRAQHYDSSRARTPETVGQGAPALSLEKAVKEAAHGHAERLAHMFEAIESTNRG